MNNITILEKLRLQTWQLEENTIQRDEEILGILATLEGFYLSRDEVDDTLVHLVQGALVRRQANQHLI